MAETLEAISFNTQPPEGGCLKTIRIAAKVYSFNTQPPEGGCRFTASRYTHISSFNTQPPEGGCDETKYAPGEKVRFNTQPPEGGCRCHSQAGKASNMFQHTAARRRLLIEAKYERPSA